MQTTKLLLASALVGGAALLVSLRSPEVASTTTTVASSTAAAQLAIDTGHSSLVFRVMHMNTAWVYGRFNAFDGKVTYDAADPTKCAVEFEVDATSVDTGSNGRDDHLRNSDFFDAKQFPKITFKSTGVKAAGEGRMEVTGDLTLRGHTEKITFEIEKTGQGKNRRGATVHGFLGTFEVDRMAHGVSYSPEGLGKTVEITVSLEAIESGGGN